MSPRTKFILIFLIFSVPFVGSTIVFLYWKPSTTSNYGELLLPVVTLPETKLVFFDQGAADNEVAAGSLRGKWLMLTRDSGNCEAACQRKLYTMRQSRLVLGREQDRLLRVVLVDDDVRPSEALIKEYAGTVWLSAKSAPWLAAFPRVADDLNKGRDPIYGVDTMGNIFIRYGAAPDIKRMTSDFQRVLKASQIG